MAEPLVSVVVPAYNAGDRIGVCLQALMNQTYRHLEIVVVDDGSTDNTCDVLEELARQDERIKLLRNKVNSGVSVSRNRGISDSTGEYILFCDSDDYYEIEAVEVLVSQASDGFDLVVADYYLDDGNQKKQRYVISGCPEHPSNQKALESVNISCCSKLFNRNLISETGMYFVPGVRVNEEVTFTIVALAKAKKIKALQAPLYNYYQRGESVSNSANLERIGDYTRAWSRVKDLLGDFTNNPVLMSRFCGSIVYDRTIDMCKAGASYWQILRSMQAFNANFPGWLYNKYLWRKGLPRIAVFLSFYFALVYPMKILSFIHSKLLG